VERPLELKRVQRSLFATPVTIVDFAPGPMHAAFAGFVHEIRSSERLSLETSARSAWSSRFDLLERGNPALARLAGMVRSEVSDIHQRAHDDAYAEVGAEQAPPLRAVEVASTSAWAVVLQPGGFQHRHVHGSSDYIAVYMVESGTEGGAFVVDDPRPAYVATTKPVHGGFRSVEFAAQPGRLLVLPGWMTHAVELVGGDEERLTINFDLSVTFAA